MPTFEELKNNKNWLQGQELAKESKKRLKQANLDHYNQNPKLCAYCNNPIPYETILSSGKSTRFCSKSCSSKVTNVGRKKSQETKELLSKMFTGRKLSGTRSAGGQKYCNVHFTPCKNCGTLIISRGSYIRATCSEKCKRERFSKVAKERGFGTGNLGFHTCWYDSPSAGTIYLDSSYELALAQLLDEHAIKWTRPQSLPWLDHTGVQHYYSPDFYLSSVDVHIETKNPYLMKRDRYKLRVVMKTHPIKLHILDLPDINLEVINCILEGTFQGHSKTIQL